jgi:hypothetical protein
MDWTLTLGECLGPRFSYEAPALLDLYFENLHTPYAEVSNYIPVNECVVLNTLRSKIRQSIIATFLMIMGDEVWSFDIALTLPHIRHSGGQNSLTPGLCC